MALSRKEFDDRLAERGLTPEQADYLRREYYKDAVKPSLKSVPSATRKQVITDWGIVAPPAQQSARTRDHLVESFKENALPHYGDIAKGAARTLVDEGPTALLRRTSGKVADVAYDAVASRVGLPTSTQQDKATGRAPGRRILPVTPGERSAGENIGGFVGGFADPINLAAPLNVFAKAAPVAKGINLLPRVAPAVAPAVAKGALGAGATNAGIAGVTSAAGQVLDERSLLEQARIPLNMGVLPGIPDSLAIEAPKVLTDTVMGGVGGALLGGPAGAMGILAARDAARRGGAAAMADAAARAAAAPNLQLPAPRPVLALPPARSGPILPSDGTVIPAPRGPVQYTPGVAPEALAARAADDYLLPSFEPDAPAPVRPAAGPRPQPVGAPKVEPVTEAPADITATVPQAVNMADLPIRSGRMNLADAEVDAQTFQFKETSDPYGLTDRLKGDVKWDAETAEARPALIFVPREGRPKIADGHQRSGLARRLRDAGQVIPDSNVRFLREVDGWTPELAMRRAALQNVQDGTGTAVDVARLMRDNHLDERALSTIPPNSANYRDGQELAKLSPNAFTLVTSGKVKPSHAATVGRHVLDPDEQEAVMGILARRKVGSAAEAENIVRFAQAMGHEKSVTPTLWGDQIAVDPLIEHGAAILEKAKGMLASEKNALGNLLRNEGRVTAVKGNKVNQAATQAAQDEARQIEALLSVEAHRPGAVRDALRDAAAAVKGKAMDDSQAANAVLAALEGRATEARKGGKTWRDLILGESGQASMPHPDDVRAAGNAAIDAGISAAEIAARPMRAMDALIEQFIGFTRADVPMRIAGGLARRGKDAAKERLRTGVTGGAVDPIDKAGQFFVSSKAPTQYQDLKDAIRSQTIRQMQGLTDEAARLERSGADQEALYDIVTDRNLASPDADAVRAKTNQVSQDLLDVGSLTPQQQAKWAGEYLPRSYADKDNAIAGLAKRARRAVTLSGSKRRGQVKELTPDALAVRQKPWQEAGIAADGRVVLEDPTTGQTILVARRNVGDFTAEWSNVGTAKGGKVKAWRDWTPTEREAMGELKNVSHALRKIAATAMGDLNNGRLLKAVSENPEWAVPDSPGITPPDGWVLVDTAVVKSNGVRKWGRLAGHWVEPTIARDLAAATNNDALGEVVKILRTYTGINQFKKVKVVYNPASHGNQLMQNMITLEAAGGSVSDVPRAARMLRTVDDPTIVQFRELGLYGDDYLSTEGMAGAGSNEYLDWGAMAGIPRVAASLDEAASSLYQFSDNMTRTAYVLGKVDEGVPVEDAIRQARERFYNGNTVNSGFARLGSASLLPFVKPALYTLDRLPELIEANPVKAVKILAYWMAFDQGLKAASGHLGDEEGRQALLPDYQKGIAKTVPLPFTNTRGDHLLFDYQRMNPIGSTFGVNDRTGFGPVPEAFVPTGGPLGGLGQTIANRDLFRDKPLRTSTDNDTLGFLANHFMPGFTGNAQRLGRAITGAPESDGETFYDVPTAAAGMFGLKVQPFRPEKGYDQNMRKFESEADDLRAKSNRIARDLENRQISQEQHDRAQAIIEAQFDALNARYEEWDAKAQQGLRAFGVQP